MYQELFRGKKMVLIITIQFYACTAENLLKCSRISTDKKFNESNSDNIDKMADKKKFVSKGN